MGHVDGNAWIEEVDFDVRVFGMDGEDVIPDDVEYPFRRLVASMKTARSGPSSSPS